MGAGGGGGKGGSPPAQPDWTQAVERQAASGHINQVNPFGSTGWQQGPDGRWTQTTQLGGPTTEDAVYKQYASRLDPQWQQRGNEFESRMAAQGLEPGTQAYDSARTLFDQARNDAYASAQRGAQTTGYQESLGALGTLPGVGQQSQYLPAAMAAYQGGLQNYGIQQQGKNSMMSGLGNLGGTAAMLAL